VVWFAKLFGSLVVFVHYCFDRIVIHKYLSGLSRPEQLVYFFRQVVGVPAVTKELLSGHTGDYQRWVEASPVITISPSSGLKKGGAKRSMCGAGSARCSGGSSLACTSSSRAWSKGGHSGVRSRSIRPRTPITASSPRSEAASRITTSIFAGRSPESHRDARGLVLPLPDNLIEDVASHPTLEDGNLTVYFETEATRKAYLDMPVDHPNLHLPYPAADNSDRGG